MAFKIYLWWIKSIMTVWRHINKGRTFQVVKWRFHPGLPVHVNCPETTETTYTSAIYWWETMQITMVNIFLLQRDAGFFYSHFVSLTPGTRNSYYGTTRNKATQVRDQHLWSYFSQDIFLLKVNVVCELGMRVSESPVLLILLFPSNTIQQSVN